MKKRSFGITFSLASVLLLGPVIASASPIKCATGDLAKYGTTVKAPQLPESRRAIGQSVPDSGVALDGSINEGGSVQQITLADVKAEQSRTNTNFENALRDISLYCTTGIMGNKKDCARGKKEFLDILAWSYNSKTPIDCKYLKKVSSKTQEKIIKDPIQFLKKSRFSCGSSGDELCCVSCLYTGSRSDSKY